MPVWADNLDLIAVYTIGTWVLGVGTFTTVKPSLVCSITNYEYSGEASARDSSTLCNLDTINQPGRRSGTISFDARVPVTAAGRLFKGKERLPIRLEVSENATVATPEVYFGMIQSVRHTVANDDLQVESVTIMLGINFVAPV